MIVSVPFSAAAAPPEIPASRYPTPRSASRSCSRRVEDGADVDRSMSTWPGRANASSPSEDGRVAEHHRLHGPAVRQRKQHGRRPVAYVAERRGGRRAHRLRLPGTQVIPGDAAPRRRRGAGSSGRPCCRARQTPRSARRCSRSPLLLSPQVGPLVERTEVPRARAARVPHRGHDGRPAVHRHHSRRSCRTASSDSRNATTDAISSGVPARRSGAVAARRTMSARPAGVNSAVGTMPGATALTLMPSGPPYIAAPCSSPSTACLDVW